MFSCLFSSQRARCLAAIATVIAIALLATGALAQTPSLFTDKELIPKDAIVLFDGKDLSQWRMMGQDKPAPWKIDDSYALARGGSIRTRQEFGDCQLHVEFWLPLMADQKGQYRANSGVYLNGLYEVQVLDSYGLKPNAGDCGALYSITGPMVNACRPPETWQAYDIFFRAPKFDAAGKKIANARISVLQNGVWIHDNADLPHPTANYEAPEVAKGPIELQFHGNPIRYRNVWIRPLNGGN